MEIIDRKFKITAVNPCKPERTYTERDGVFFCAKDAALIPALWAYRDECKRMRCGEEHLHSIVLLIERVQRYQEEVERRVPDTDTDCEIRRSIGGEGLGD